MYNIRRAELIDIEDLFVCMMDFKEFASDYTDFINPETTELLIERLILDGIFFVAEDTFGIVVGAIGGKIVPSHFDDNTLIAAELFWWVEEQHRGSMVGQDLLEAFEEDAKEKGCDLVSMSILRDTPEPVEKALGKNGYSCFEKNYVKRIY